MEPRLDPYIGHNVIENIISYLDLQDSSSLSSVSKTLNEVCSKILCKTLGFELNNVRDRVQAM